MNELAKDVKSSKEKGWFTLENQEKLFEAGIVVFKLLLTKIKNKLYSTTKNFYYVLIHLVIKRVVLKILH